MVYDTSSNQPLLLVVERRVTHPNRTQPREHESPACRPGSEISRGREYPGRVVPFLAPSYRQSNDRGENKNKIHHDERGL
jgi:hypothetical protein